MKVEPKLVESGFIFRWLEQSLRLILRSLFTWICLILISIAVSLVPVNIFFKSFLGLWLMLLGIEVAILSDVGGVSIRKFMRLFWNATEGFLFQIYFKIIFYSLMFLIYVGVTLCIDRTDIPIGVLSNIGWTYGLGLLSLSGVGFQLYTHLYSKFFNSIDKRMVNYNCKLGARINYKVEIFFELYVVINLFLVGMVLPDLCFILYPLTCTFIYVSFREMFLGRSENGLIEENFKLS